MQNENQLVHNKVFKKIHISLKDIQVEVVPHLPVCIIAKNYNYF